jgi:hypothetical protein
VRSHTECLRIVATVAALLTSLLSMAAAPVVRTAGSKLGRPTHAEIDRALGIVKADPNLSSEHTVKTLRWTSAESEPSKDLGWLTWIAGLFWWLDQSARVLVWGVIVTLAGVLVVYVVRVARGGAGDGPGEGSFIAPTHVRELDIRPESLPSNIGAAARALWDNGEHRASLALLYRGTLSRLAHVHDVPIRDSSTEGDCIALATGRLPQTTCEYVSRVVRVWQRFGYGHEDVREVVVHGLCDDFAPLLDLPSAAVSIPTEGAA